MLFINSESRWGELFRAIGSKGDPVFSHAKLYTISEVKTILERSGYKVVQEIETLTSDPVEPDVGGEISKPSKDTGVILVKSIPSK